MNRTALIQGASRGLGLALVAHLLTSPEEWQVVATSRRPSESEGLKDLARRHAEALTVVPLDVCDEGSVERAAEETRSRGDDIHLLVNCAGLLHAEGMKPEKKLLDVDAANLRRSFEVNAVGPLLVARHFWRLLHHSERSVLMNVSARVGSIEDNRLGGWYAYRAAKAAQNQFTRTLAIELARRAPRLICAAYHPGTVETRLSEPFRARVPRHKLFSAPQAAEHLLGVAERLEGGDSGSFLAWDGSRIPW